MLLRSGNKRIVIIITIFIILAMSVVLLTYYGNKAIMGTKGYIVGERHWAIAQKQSVLSLVQYAKHKDEKYFENFNRHLEIIDEDRQARLTLSSNDPDYQVAYEGFQQDNLAEEEIDSMIWVFRKFNHLSFVQEAIDIWKEGDEKIEEVRQIAAQLHESINDNHSREEEVDQLIDQLFLLDAELTVLEHSFSNTIREASIQIEKLITRTKLIILMLLITTGGYVTVKYYREIHQLNKQLSDAESKFRNVLENSQDIIYQMDPEGADYEYISPSVQKITGYTPEEVKRGGVEFLKSKIHPEDLEKYEEEWEKIYTGELDKFEDNESEFRIKTKWGHYIWINNKRSTIKDEYGEPVEIVGNIRDISDEKKYLETLNKSIKEKGILLAEIHHRVKNNLAIVSGLIEMQKNEPFESVRETLNELQSRIKSVALIHEKLYNSETFNDVKMSNYITELTNFISKAYQSENLDISIEMDLDPLTMKAVDAVLVGLIYNEMINNVYKHAYKGKMRGIVKINLKDRNDKIELKVIDDGIGLPDNFSIENCNSLGMTIIKELTEQLKGNFSVRSNSHTEFHVNFKKSET